MKSFVNRQLEGISREGFAALKRKGSSLVLLLLAILPLVFIRAIRPLVAIRFIELISDRIGPYAGEPEVYCSEKDAGMHGGRVFDVFYNQPYICNDQLKVMWDRSLRVWQFARPVGRLNSLIPGGRSHVVPWRVNEHRDLYGVMVNSDPHIGFTAEENRRGEDSLREMGVTEESKFVCVHTRDESYMAHRFPSLDLYRYSYRDSSIQNYIPAMEELVSRGYYVIRIGAVVEEPLVTDNSMIIDYATKYRSEFMDIYLCAMCDFAILTTSGIEKVPMVFRRPSMYANYLPYDHLPTWGPQDLCIPKKLWLRKENRFLSFEEIIGSEINRYGHMELYETAGIEVIENTADEIKDLAMEMDDRINGRWVSDDEDEELQAKFWGLFKPSEDHGVVLGRAGAYFLRNNKNLFDQSGINTRYEGGYTP